jgi:WD40 repeat protein
LVLAAIGWHFLLFRRAILPHEILGTPLNTGEEKFSWSHHSKLSTVAISPDDKYALTNEGLGTIRLWKTQTGKLYKQLGPKLITLSSAAFSDNSKYLVAGRVSQRIDLWNIRSGEIINYWRPKKDSFWKPTAATILALTFSANNRCLNPKVLLFYH